MVSFVWKDFLALNVDELYDILTLRSKVFVVEQNCIYLDMDGRDKNAFHLLGKQEDALVAYLRVFYPTLKEPYIVFGRVATAKDVRSKGYGKQLMQELLNYCGEKLPGVSIKCSAQYYLKKFYESFGFRALGDVYEEDGIPHIKMERI